MLRRIARALLRRLNARSGREAYRSAATVFDEWALDGRAEQMEAAHSPVVNRILQGVDLRPRGRFLDIGCGNGYAVRSMASRSGRAVGLDASREMVARARALLQGIPNATVEHDLFPHHPLSPGSFELIFSMETMYYMTDLDRALREVLSLLAPGGSFLAAVDFYKENRQCLGIEAWVGTPMKLLSARGWRRAFEHAGFRSVSQERVIVPVEEARESWHATVGCLVTRGMRSS